MRNMILILACWFWASALFGAEGLRPENQTLRLLLASQDESRLDADTLGRWKSVCTRLGQFLQQNQQQVGTYSRFSCDPGTAPGEWVIQVIDRRRFFEIELRFAGRLVRSFSFRLDGDLIDNLSKGSTLEILAAMLIESSPLGWVMTVDAETTDIRFLTRVGVPPLPLDLFVYDLSFDSQRQLWLPRIRAKLKRVSLREGQGSQRTERFRVAESYLPLRVGGSYWVQNAQGFEARQKQFEEILGKDLLGFSVISFLDRLIFESFESNFAGIRYGKSMIQGKSLLTEADLLSILIEIRSGPLEGLRWYYDMAPTVSRKVEGYEETFGWRRASLGWAFGLEMPHAIQPFLSRIDIQPKFGLLDFQSRFLYINEIEERQSLAFEARNIYDLSVEVGIEKESYWFRSRLWGAINSAKFGLSNQSGLSVNSRKAGFDVYLDLVEWGEKMDTNLLIFALSEQLAMTKDREEVLEGNDAGISALSYSLFYLGGGLTLTW